MQFYLSDIAEATGGRLVGADRPIEGLAIDSRLVTGGELFAAVRGERDGHDFVTAALDGGAGAALVERVPEALDGRDGAALVVVDEVMAALADLSRLARKQLGDRVIGITGSVGKTTAKDLAASIMSQKYATTASEKSFNNELGVPLTLFNTPAGTDVTIVEMGARGVGHIAYLCSMASPVVGVVTTVEAVHTETMGGVEQIARIKGELVESLPAHGVAVLNADVPAVAALSERSDARVVTFGRTGQVRARGIELDDTLTPTFVLVSPWGEVSVRLGVRGVHNVMNALAAAAVGLSLGLSPDQVAEGLAVAEHSPWRMEVGPTAAGATMINDCYNAGPASMRAAFEALGSIDVDPGSGRYAVVGVMAELGDGTVAAHHDIATMAADMGVRLLAVGTDLYGTEPDVTVVPDVPSAIEVVESWGLDHGDALLIKGSRVAGLECIAEVLRERSG